MKHKEKSEVKNLEPRYFRLLVGTHYDENETVYVAKDPKRNIVKSYEDLVSRFRGKFEEITERVANERRLAKEEMEQVDQESNVSYGKDVSLKFPKAKKAKMLVFRNKAKEYFVVDPDSGKAINKKPLAKDSVSSFLSLQMA